jgi:FKBP-type peptidyl-prolyl cis-trans isomerase
MLMLWADQIMLQLAGTNAEFALGTRILVVFASLVVIALVIGAVIVMHNGNSSAKSSSSGSPDVKGAQATPTPSGSPSSTGLQATDEVVGTGAEAKEGSTITVKYTGSLQDGTVFDSTDKHGGQPATFQLAKGQLIDGWVQGIPGMKVGGKRKLVIPPDLGYGAQGQSGIPANSTLVFEIELVGIK